MRYRIWLSGEDLGRAMDAARMPWRARRQIQNYFYPWSQMLTIQPWMLNRDPVVLLEEGREAIVAREYVDQLVKDNLAFDRRNVRSVKNKLMDGSEEFLKLPVYKLRPIGKLYRWTRISDGFVMPQATLLAHAV